MFSIWRSSTRYQPRTDRRDGGGSDLAGFYEQYGGLNFIRFHRDGTSGFGDLLNEGWKLKRTLASGISNPAIDEAYETTMPTARWAANCWAPAAPGIPRRIKDGACLHTRAVFYAYFTFSPCPAGH